jgi:hypothetical protein
LQSFYHVVKELVDQQVFFTYGQLVQALHDALEQHAINNVAMRDTWITNNIGRVWAAQYKERSNKFKEICVAYSTVFDHAHNPGVYAPDFKFWRGENKANWRVVCTGLSKAWKIYARICLQHLNEEQKSSLPTRTDQLYCAWRAKVTEKDVADLQQFKMGKRPTLPSNLQVKRSRGKNGKRARTEEEEYEHQYGYAFNDEEEEEQDDHRASPRRNKRPIAPAAADPAAAAGAPSSDELAEASQDVEPVNEEEM